MTINIYSMRISPPCRAVLMTARQLNIGLNIKTTDVGEGDHLKPEFLKLNPARTVPVIDDDGFVLWESRAIMQYLCNKYAPESTLYPKDPMKRAIVDRWLNFDMSLVVLQREVLIEKMFGGSAPTDEKIKALKNNLKLADQLIGENKYLTGNELTIADFSLLPIIGLFGLLGYDLTDFPNVQRWMSSLKSELHYYEEINHFEMEEVMAFAEKNKARLLQQKQNQ